MAHHARQRRAAAEAGGNKQRLTFSFAIRLIRYAFGGLGHEEIEAIAPRFHVADGGKYTDLKRNPAPARAVTPWGQGHRSADPMSSGL
jgi:hypothetical protein